MISARQVNTDTLSSLNDSIVFPLEGHLVNHTTGVIPAQITIPTELLTQSLNSSGGNVKHIIRFVYLINGVRMTEHTLSLIGCICMGNHMDLSAIWE